jgi:hypothetical protein
MMNPCEFALFMENKRELKKSLNDFKEIYENNNGNDILGKNKLTFPIVTLRKIYDDLLYFDGIPEISGHLEYSRVKVLIEKIIENGSRDWNKKNEYFNPIKYFTPNFIEIISDYARSNLPPRDLTKTNNFKNIIEKFYLLKPEFFEIYKTQNPENTLQNWYDWDILFSPLQIRAVSWLREINSLDKYLAGEDEFVETEKYLIETPDNSINRKKLKDRDAFNLINKKISNLKYSINSSENLICLIKTQYKIEDDFDPPKILIELKRDLEKTKQESEKLRKNYSTLTKWMFSKDQHDPSTILDIAQKNLSVIKETDQNIKIERLDFSQIKEPLSELNDMLAQSQKIENGKMVTAMPRNFLSRPISTLEVGLADLGYKGLVSKAHLLLDILPNEETDNKKILKLLKSFSNEIAIEIKKYNLQYDEIENLNSKKI